MAISESNNTTETAISLGTPPLFLGGQHIKLFTNLLNHLPVGVHNSCDICPAIGLESIRLLSGKLIKELAVFLKWSILVLEGLNSETAISAIFFELFHSGIIVSVFLVQGAAEFYKEA